MRQVRSRVDILTARRVERPGQYIALISGVRVRTNIGDWIVANGTAILSVCNTDQLDALYAPVEEGLLLSRSVCTKIEDVTGVGTTQSPETLVAAIDRLAKIEIGEIRVPFTPGQLVEIKHRASKRGYTVLQELTRIVDRIKDEIFHHS